MICDVISLGNDLVLLLQSFSILDWIWIVNAIIMGTLPVFLLIKHFFSTRSLDYLIYAGVLFFGALDLFIAPFFFNTFDLTIFKLNACIHRSVYFLLFIHAIRLRYEWKEKPFLLLFGLIWYIIIIILTLFRVETPYYNEPFEQFGSVYILAAGMLLLYSYVYVTPINPTSRILFVRKANLAVGIILVTYGIWGIIAGFIPIINQELFAMISGLLLFPLGVILIYIALRYPESMLITQVQLLRAKELYKEVQKLPPENLGQNALITYLSSIPKEIIKEIE